MSDATHIKRLKWACRRGMLELDVLFLPFVEQAYEELSANDKAIFERLLSCDDPDLFAWVMGHQNCDDPELSYMIKMIVNRVKV